MSHPRPAEELSEKKQGNIKEEKPTKKKLTRKQKQKAKNQGTYGLTKAEDKEPHRTVAQVQEPPQRSNKPPVLQGDSSQQRSTMPEESKPASTAKAHSDDSTPRPSRVSPQADSPVAVPPNATWQEVCQFAFNSSILFGSFEDATILACSRRSQALARVGGVRALHANSALVRKALTNGHLLLDTGVLPDVLEDADLRNIDASFQSGHHDYLEDSDLEDGEITIVEWESDREAQSEDEDDIVEEPAVNGAKTSDADEIPNSALASDPTHPTTGDELEEVIEIREAETHEDGDETSAKSGDAASVHDHPALGPVGKYKTEASPENHLNSKATGRVQANGTKGHVKQPSKANDDGHRDIGLRPGTRTVLVTDTAFQTLRTFIFYAYTGRVAFAPLRSQGMIYQDDGRDPSQLPVCSPKSMYRLAVKYGNETLRFQAGIDIQSKLSTQNILGELFSQFTCRYLDIQEMELNFLLAHIKHPDITVRLPWWIDRFAHGELAACADTFGKLIHKLACIASAPPNMGQPVGPMTCPRGCQMPTMRTQSRCDTCGYVMTA